MKQTNSSANHAARVTFGIAATALVAALAFVFISATTGPPVGTVARGSQAQAVETTVTIEPTQTPAAAEPQQVLTVFTYHHVSPTADNFICITPAMFEEHLKRIRDGRFTPITADDLSVLLASGAPLPSKPLMITFDDGWTNQYRYAAPLLDEYGFKATFFVYPKVLKGGTFMSPEQIADLRRRGHAIGSHTWGHVPLLAERAESESAFANRIVASQLVRPSEWIADTVGSAPTSFAYPFGYYDTYSAALVSQTGHELAFTTDEAPNVIGQMDPLLLRRFTVLRAHGAGDFSARLNASALAAHDLKPARGERLPGNKLVLEASVEVGEIDPQTAEFIVDNKPVRTSVETSGTRAHIAADWSGKDGFHYIILRVKRHDGGLAYASWGAVTGR